MPVCCGMCSINEILLLVVAAIYSILCYTFVLMRKSAETVHIIKRPPCATTHQPSPNPPPKTPSTTKKWIPNKRTNERTMHLYILTTPGRQFDLMPVSGVWVLATHRPPVLRKILHHQHHIMSSSSSYEIRNAKKENTLYTANFDCLAPNPKTTPTTPCFGCGVLLRLIHRRAAPKTERLSPTFLPSLPLSDCLSMSVVVWAHKTRARGKGRGVEFVGSQGISTHNRIPVIRFRVCTPTDSIGKSSPERMENAIPATLFATTLRRTHNTLLVNASRRRPELTTLPSAPSQTVLPQPASLSDCVHASGQTTCRSVYLGVMYSPQTRTLRKHNRGESSSGTGTNAGELFDYQSDSERSRSLAMRLEVGVERHLSSQWMDNRQQPVVFYYSTARPTVETTSLCQFGRGPVGVANFGKLLLYRF